MIGRRVWVGGRFHWCCAECQILSLPVPLPVFSASSPKQPAIIGPPILYSPLHLSLPSRHPASCPLDTPAPQCSHAPLPRLPPSPLAVVTWCLNSSSLNSATSTLTGVILKGLTLQKFVSDVCACMFYVCRLT